ncbi:MAG: hypothetical protein JWM44_3021 [Bacilli bacterium]|nr:hypothetical protein [Bacilli bacterium]
MTFPLWFNETIQKRLEAISLPMKQDDLIHSENIRFDEVFRSFMAGLDEEMKAQFLLLEELWVGLEGLEKESIYVQGMKDGAQLLLSLLHTDAT